MNKRILILYTSIGLGHKTIAQNIGAHLTADGHEVKLFDTLELQSGWLVEVGTIIHAFINQRTPLVWKWLYTSKWFTDVTLGSRVKVASKNYSKTKAAVDEFQPDLILTTQTTPSAIIEFMKQQEMYHGKFVIAFSDYHLHRYWLYSSADLYLVNIEEQRQDMILLGVPADKIIVCGVSLLPPRSVDLVAAREVFGFSSEDKIVLVGSGSLGYGGLADIIIAALGDQLVSHNVKLVVLTGKNEQRKHTLEHYLQDHGNIKVIGFHTPMEELYAISEMILSKPGGLTVAETLQWNIPMLITHWLPGQEEINYDYLTAKKLVMPRPAVITASTLSTSIIEELGTRAFRNQLSTNEERQNIVQFGREGELLKKAVKSLFHEV